MTQTIESLFQQGIERYQAGESAEVLLPVFQDVCDRAAKNSPAWTCLAWLYLLADQEAAALKAAQRAVKLNPEDAQARINLAIALLETGQKGVRQHIDLVRQLMVVPELRQEVQQNFDEGLKRKPDWQALQKVQSWIFEG
jgi:predicted Zn-dependent protease